MNAIYSLEINTWAPPMPSDQGATLAREIESGRVLYLPQLSFALADVERQFLDPRWSNGKDKNISLENENGLLKGVAGKDEELSNLRTFVARYRAHAGKLINNLFPKYTSSLRLARTSYRPVRVEGREVSWRQDDSRLHVDAFPSRPNHGERILRVFSNVNPQGEARVWRVGEPFEELAQRMLPRIPRPIFGSAWLMETLSITKSRRSEYDHIMLHLHDEMKRNLDYQRSAPQITMPFSAGSTWICFSDQTSHAAMSGQYMLEQTLHLPVDALYEPNSSPLRTLERLTRRMLA